MATQYSPRADSGKAHTPPPPKPKGSPLYPSNNGYWIKRINGKIHRFGRWGRQVEGKLVRLEGDGYAEAKTIYDSQKEALHTGRTPREDRDGLTVGQLRDLFLTAKSRALDAGDITSRTYFEYKATTSRLIAKFGESRFVDDLTMEDFAGLRGDHDLIASIRRQYSGVPVGASESIFAMLAPALGLRLITPPTFLRAISEGSEVSAADKSTIDRQIADHRIKIYVYNSQNATPDIAAQLAGCKRAHIPIASITETLAPSSASYQQWQTTELRGILQGSDDSR